MKCLLSPCAAGAVWIGHSAWAADDAPKADPASPPVQQSQKVDLTRPFPGPKVDPEVKQARQVTEPEQPPPAPAPTPAANAPRVGEIVPTTANLTPARAEQAAGGNALVSGQDAPFLGSTDAGDLLTKSNSGQGIESQKRSPIANETRIRGEHLGQILTQSDGVDWFPARQDLDTFLSKIDSGVVKDIIVVKGPYSAIYGPGFSFIDIETDPSPRSNTGFDVHGRLLGGYKFNGQQLNGLASISAADCDWGVRLTYDQRNGNLYQSGNDTVIPSRYDSGNVDSVMGVDLSRTDHLEFGYMRLDQNGLEFPGQVFDTDFLVTNAYRLRYTSEKKDWYDRLTIDGFYNRTSMHGDAQNPDTRAFIPQLNAELFTGFTYIDQASSGYRIMATYGDPKELQLNIGTDMHYRIGQLNEFDSRGGLGTVCFSFLNFPIPPNQQIMNGLFSELIDPVNDRWTFKVGVRGDYVTTNITGVPPGFSSCTNFYLQANHDYFGVPFGTTVTDDFAKAYMPWMAYATAEYKPTDVWAIDAKLGHAERPPTETELYAMGPFLAILQQGFTTVIGSPFLADEKLWQGDLSTSVKYQCFRAGAGGYCSLIQDYITVQPASPAQSGLKLPQSATNALTVQFVNTQLAELAGCEAYAEYDATDWLTPFVTLSYVEGFDLTRGQRPPGPLVGTVGSEALPGIVPIEGRIGIRLHDASAERRYGVEFSSRLVGAQGQVATSLGEVASPGFVIFDARAYWQVTKNLLVTAGIENFTNQNYREHLDLLTGTPFGPGVFQPGINPYLGVQYVW
jgi:outer membrane receptor protein involved in Fe transport